MRVFIFIVALIFMFGMSPVFCNADVDLVKLKKEEEERRKKNKKPVVTITNEKIKDLKPMSKKDSSKSRSNSKDKSKAPRDEAATFSNQSEGINSEGVTQQQTKEYWRTKVKNLENKIQDAQKDIDQKKLELNEQMTLSLSQIDSPTQRTEIQNRMDSLRKEINQKDQEIAALKKQLEDLFDSARKEGIPPGWLR